MPGLLMLLLGGLAVASRRRRMGLLLAGLLMMVGMWVACGGGGGWVSSPTASNGTPAGTFNLTVTGTYTSGTAVTAPNLSHSTALTLTVN
jgi:hypothetical protein